MHEILPSFAITPFVSYPMYLSSNRCTPYSQVCMYGAVLRSTFILIKFSERDVQDLFNDLLKIALATNLPTPHANKTWSLAFWIIQVQNLPFSVLDLNKVEIATALRQSISDQNGFQAKLDSLKVVFSPFKRTKCIFISHTGDPQSTKIPFPAISVAPIGSPPISARKSLL